MMPVQNKQAQFEGAARITQAGSGFTVQQALTFVKVPLGLV